MFTRHPEHSLVRYNVTEIVDGKPKRAQRSQRLCATDGKDAREVHETKTTLHAYKKQITPEAFENGLKAPAATEGKILVALLRKRNHDLHLI